MTDRSTWPRRALLAARLPGMGRIATSLVSLVALVAFTSIGCKTASDREAEAKSADCAELQRLIDADIQLDRVLKRADDLAKTDEAGAADLLDHEAASTATSALAVGGGTQVKTPWGIARRDEILAVLRDRSAAIAPYAAALRGTDIDQKLAAAQAELALEQRVLDALERVTDRRLGCP